MVAVLEPVEQQMWEALDRKAVQPLDYQRQQKALCLAVVQEGSAARKLTGMRQEAELALRVYESSVNGEGLSRPVGQTGSKWVPLRGAKVPAASASGESPPEGPSSKDPWRLRWRPDEEGRNPPLAVSDSSASIAIEVISRDMTSIFNTMMR